MVSPSSNPGATADQQGDLIVVDSMRPFKTVVPKFQFWKNFIQLSEVHFESPEKKNMVLLFLLWWIFLSPKCQNMSKWRPEMVLFVFWHICQCKLFCKDTSCIRSVVVKWVGQQCAGPGEI